MKLNKGYSADQIWMAMEAFGRRTDSRQCAGISVYGEVINNLGLQMI